MKKHYKFLLTALFSLILLGACSPDDDTTGSTTKPEADKVIISTTNLTAEAYGSTGTLTFTTNKSWTASSDKTWCKLDKTSGNAGNSTINLTFESNPTEEERTAQITITAGTASAQATVTQAKQEPESETGDGNSIDDMQNQKW